MRFEVFSPFFAGGVGGVRLFLCIDPDATAFSDSFGERPVDPGAGFLKF
jgi:hypothetical protein